MAKLTAHERATAQAIRERADAERAARLDAEAAVAAQEAGIAAKAAELRAEHQCPKCRRSAVRPDFATCDDCAADGIDSALHTVAAARDVLLEAIDSGILDAEALDGLGSDPRLEDELRGLTAAGLRGLIDAERARERKLERVRLAKVLFEWSVNGTVDRTRDVELIRTRLLATDY